jgi:TRAP-type C4-dicarboxylate transport system permease small subunit
MAAKNGFIKNLLYNLPEFGLALLTICITIVVFAELSVREIWGVSIFGYTNDLTRFCMVWLSLLGAAVAVKRGSHFVFPILAQKFGPNAAPYLSIISTLTIMAFAAVLIVVGTKVAIIHRNEKFIAIGISRFWQNIAVPISGVLMFLYSLAALPEQIRSLRGTKTHQHQKSVSSSNESEASDKSVAQKSN